MKSRCPACRRTTRVPTDQLGFPVRCDRCRTILLARPSDVDSAPTDQPPSLQILPLGLFAEAPATQSSQHLEDLLTRPPPSTRPISQYKPPFRPRAYTHVIIVSVLLVAIIVAAAILAITLKRQSPSQARAAPVPAMVPAIVPAPVAAPSRTPKPAVPRLAEAPPQISAPESDGELFPSVPARR